MSRLQANCLLLLTAFLWGSGNVAQRTILEDIGPFAAIGLRCLIAAIVILPVALRQGRPRLGGGRRRALLLMGLTAGSFAAATTAMQISYGYTTVTNASFLVNTTTVMIPFAVWLLLKQRPGPAVWPAALITLAGTWLMSGGSFMHRNSGDVLCFIAAVCYTIWFIYLGEFVLSFGFAGLVSIVQFALTAAVTLLLSAAFETTTLSGLWAATPELIYLGAVSTGLAYFLQGMAQRHTPACEAAIIVSAEALFGALSASYMLGERLSPGGFLGAALITFGIVLVQLPLGAGWLVRRKTVALPAPATETGTS